MKIFVLNNCRKYCWLAVLIVLFSSFKKGNSFDQSGQAEDLGMGSGTSAWLKKNALTRSDQS